MGKTEEELKIAINKKILLINCESESEAKLVNNLAKKLRKKVSIGFRLNPNVDAKTHKNISTGKAENKFGLSIKNFKVFLKTVKTFKNVKLEALSVHIGSQILNDAPFRKTLNVMSKLIRELKLNLKYVDLGGGFGINYTDKEKPILLGLMPAFKAFNNSPPETTSAPAPSLPSIRSIFKLLLDFAAKQIKLFFLELEKQKKS